MEQSQSCTGWWAQRGKGRQDMDGLRMTVRGGRVSGSGLDIVGAFTFEGSLQGDRVEMTKRYFGAMPVLYTGHYDGDRRLWGTWHLPAERGPWEITLREGLAEEAALEAEQAEAAPLER